MENNVLKCHWFCSLSWWCACTIPKVIILHCFETRTRNLRFQNKDFLKSPIQSGIGSVFAAMNVSITAFFRIIKKINGHFRFTMLISWPSGAYILFLLTSKHLRLGRNSLSWKGKPWNTSRNTSGRHYRTWKRWRNTRNRSEVKRNVWSCEVLC